MSKTIKALFQLLREYVIVYGGRFFFGILKRTWFTSEDTLPVHCQHELEAGKPVVFAHLHQDEWALLGVYGGRGMNVLVSHSKDGSLMARYLKSAGFQVARGSSSKGAISGYRQLLKQVQESSEKRVSVAVDGPRGPYGKVKRGVIKLALHLDASLVIGTAEASRKWVFEKSWSKAYIPKPFSRVRLKYPAFKSSDELIKMSDYQIQQWAEKVFEEKP